MTSEDELEVALRMLWEFGGERCKEAGMRVAAACAGVALDAGARCVPVRDGGRCHQALHLSVKGTGVDADIGENIIHQRQAVAVHALKHLRVHRLHRLVPHPAAAVALPSVVSWTLHAHHDAAPDAAAP